MPSLPTAPAPRRRSVAPGDRMRAKDLAQSEGLSISTARRLMHSGKVGPIHGRNQRDRWIDRRLYLSWLATL